MCVYVKDLMCASSVPSAPFLRIFFVKMIQKYAKGLGQGLSTPEAQAGASLWPIRSQAAQQETTSRQVSKVLSVFTVTFYHPHYYLRLPPVYSVATLHTHRNGNSVVNCLCKGWKLHNLHVNLVTNDLKWS